MRLGMAVLAALLAATPEPVPARLKVGPLPPLPGVNVGSGEVLIEVAVDAAGRVASTRTLRDSPPWTEALTGSVKSWVFEPARDAAGKAAPATVLVAGSFRPATVLGPAPGEPPRDVAAPAPGTPFPLKTSPALYPPLGRGDGQAIVEITIAPDGTGTPRIARSAPGFDDAALQSAREWRFRATAGGGRAYVVYGFRGLPG